MNISSLAVSYKLTHLHMILLLLLLQDRHTDKAAAGIGHITKGPSVQQQQVSSDRKPSCTAQHDSSAEQGSKSSKQDSYDMTLSAAMFFYTLALAAEFCIRCSSLTITDAQQVQLVVTTVTVSFGGGLLLLDQHTPSLLLLQMSPLHGQHAIVTHLDLLHLLPLQGRYRQSVAGIANSHCSSMCKRNIDHTLHRCQCSYCTNMSMICWCHVCWYHSAPLTATAYCWANNEPAIHSLLS